MPGTNAGTGYPLTFRCAKCKVGWEYKLGSLARRDGTRCIATGRTKPKRTRGYRQTDRLVEYRCLDCGHIGWSQHSQMERLLERRAIAIAGGE